MQKPGSDIFRKDEKARLVPLHKYSRASGLKKENNCIIGVFGLSSFKDILISGLSTGLYICVISILQGWVHVSGV